MDPLQDTAIIPSPLPEDRPFHAYGIAENSLPKFVEGRAKFEALGFPSNLAGLCEMVVGDHQISLTWSSEMDAFTVTRGNRAMITVPIMSLYFGCESSIAAMSKLFLDTGFVHKYEPSTRMHMFKYKAAWFNTFQLRTIRDAGQHINVSVLDANYPRSGPMWPEPEPEPEAVKRANTATDAPNTADAPDDSNPPAAKKARVQMDPSIKKRMTAINDNFKIHNTYIKRHENEIVEMKNRIGQVPTLAKVKEMMATERPPTPIPPDLSTIERALGECATTEQVDKMVNESANRLKSICFSTIKKTNVELGQVIAEEYVKRTDIDAMITEQVNAKVAEALSALAPPSVPGAAQMSEKIDLLLADYERRTGILKKVKKVMEIQDPFKQFAL